MKPNENPFLNKVYTSIWKKHFCPPGADYYFESFTNVEFVKTKGFPIYTNVGKRMTQGMTYEFRNSAPLKGLENKVFLIYDVPEYLESPMNNSSGFKLLKSEQYDGYLVNLKAYDTVDDYIRTNVKPKSRRLIERSKRRLDFSFDTKYHVLTGPKVTDEEYAFYFDRFRALLDQRYDSKDSQHPFLNPKVWEYHRELVLSLIRVNKAALFVIDEGENPIAINLNYLGDKVVFSALPAFDLDFQKFNLGHIMNLWTLEWCKQNGFSIYDFSKGHYDYKRRWSDVNYKVNYHILYHSESVRARILGIGLFWLFERKHLLRRSRLFSYLKQVPSWIKGGTKKEEGTYKLEMEVNLPKDKRLSETNLKEQPCLKEGVYDFLFRTQEKKDDIKLVQDKDSDGPVFILGINHTGSIIKSHKSSIPV